MTEREIIFSIAVAVCIAVWIISRMILKETPLKILQHRRICLTEEYFYDIQILYVGVNKSKCIVTKVVMPNYGNSEVSEGAIEFIDNRELLNAQVL